MSSDNSFCTPIVYHTENEPQWWKSDSLRDIDRQAPLVQVYYDDAQLRQLKEIQKELDLRTLRFLELTFKGVDHQKMNTELGETVCSSHLQDDCRSCCSSSDIEDDSENCDECKRFLDEFLLTEKYLTYLALKNKYQ